MARARTRDGQHRDALVALEESARENRAGCLWSGSDAAVDVSGFDPLGPDRDCGDFATWQQAQAFFEAAGGPHRLDGDRGGIPCESMTGAPLR